MRGGPHRPGPGGGPGVAVASILPAAWSFMVAARARGLGSVWTTFQLRHEREAAELLGVPFDAVVQAALIPVADSVGTEFRPATMLGPRRLDETVALGCHRWLPRRHGTWVSGSSPEEGSARHKHDHSHGARAVA
jgi:nitroreductase